MDSFISRFVLRAFACFGDLLTRRMDEEGNGSVIAAPFAVTLTMCVTVKGNALTEEWVGGMSVPTCRPALLCDICTSRWQRLEDSGNALVETSSIHRTFEGEVQGPYMSVQFLSVRRCTFEHCTFCCPSRDMTTVILTKTNVRAKRRLPLHQKLLLTVVYKIGGEMICQ